MLNILISGGSDGLGKALATRFAPEHQVVILSHNEEKLKQVSTDLGCEYVVADVTDFSSLEMAFKKVLEKFPRIDVLINNAGIWLQGPLSENNPQEIEEVIKVNTLGTIFLTKVVVPTMQSQGSGRIINIISQDGLRSKKDRSIYTASKWAITGFTKCLEEDLSESGIGVTGIYPGVMKTKLFEKQGEDRDLTYALDLPEVAKLVEFVINLPSDTVLPEIVIKNINNPNKMDDTTTIKPLDINPDLMSTPDTTPTPTPPPATPTPEAPKGVIDITPGASDAYHPSPLTDITPPSTPVTTPGIKLPVDQGVIDITPEENTAIASQDGSTHLADLLPQAPPAVTPEVTPTMPAEITPPPVAPVAPVAPTIPSTSPLAEDPSTVQLGK